MNLEDLEPPMVSEIEDPGDDLAWDEDSDNARIGKGVPKEDDFGNQFVTIIDSTGVHHLPILLCHCGNGIADQLPDCLRLGYFPTSFRTISTLFTTECLDDFRLANLECKTSPYQYFNYLRRKTNPAFPIVVPDRYAELRRLSRQWRIIKRELWAGLHCSAGVSQNAASTVPTSATNLSIFCPTCPQPTVNLPPNWKDIFDKYVFQFSFRIQWTKL
jgi:hypothetical protein